MRQPVEILIEKYKNNIYAIAFNVCKNVHDAEDVVQDTFIRYLSHKKDFETEQHIRAWLIRVAINNAKNKNNTFFRRNALPLEDYNEIADILKISVSNVKIRLSRGRMLLRETLKEIWEDDE